MVETNYIAFLLLFVPTRGTFTVGLQGFNSVQSVEATFMPTTYKHDSDLAAALSNNSFTCQQLVSNVQALLSIIQLASGQPTARNGGVFVAKADGNITSLAQYEELEQRGKSTQEINTSEYTKMQKTFYHTRNGTGIKKGTDINGDYVMLNVSRKEPGWTSTMITVLQDQNHLLS